MRVQSTLLARTLRKSLYDRVPDLASSIAFYASFSIFPFLLLLVAGASYVLGLERVQDQLARFVYEALPGSGDVVRESIQAVIQERGRMGAAGLIGLLWSASAAFAAATRAIHQLQGNSKPRLFVLARLRSVLVAAIVFLLLVVSVTVASAVELVLTSDRSWISAPLLEAQTVIWVFGWGSSFVIMFIVFALFYKESSARPSGWRAVWPGALLAAFIAEVGKIAFLAYVERVANLEAVFGSLTSMMLLLLWLFLAAIALLAGVEYNVVRQQSP